MLPYIIGGPHASDITKLICSPEQGPSRFCKPSAARHEKHEMPVMAYGLRAGSRSFCRSWRVRTSSNATTLWKTSSSG